MTDQERAVLVAATAYITAEQRMMDYNEHNRRVNGALGPMATPPVAEKERLRNAVKALLTPTLRWPAPSVPAERADDVESGRD
jgi:hypothetical protein